ncbi:ACT domain-containing protein [Mailhella sp.]|uniref:ACT domain-containing protein n=1 Tax=Mailhella sp. TaxID=1981029 RepID=UPI00406364FB
MVKQLSIFVQNRSGKLAAATSVLRDNGVDIRALTIADTPDFGILRILVDDAAKAEQVLVDNSFIVQATDVVVVAVPDEKGGLAALLEPMAECGVNIEYMYSLISRDVKDAYMVFRVTDNAAFLAMLAEKGLKHVTPAELGLK